MARIAPPGSMARSTEAQTAMYLGFKSFSKISIYLFDIFFFVGSAVPETWELTTSHAPPEPTILHLAQQRLLPDPP
jgi:hypothetical protein